VMKTRAELSALVARQLHMPERVVDDVVETFLTEVAKSLIVDRAVEIRPLGRLSCQRRRYGRQFALYVRFTKNRFVMELARFYGVDGPDGPEERGPRGGRSGPPPLERR
jgi:hypothetical protein